MVRLIAAVDKRLGIADDNGMPWELKADLKYFRDQTMGFPVLMGYNTYLTLKKPLEGRQNFVLTTKKEALKQGFKSVNDLNSFIDQYQKNLWIIGGANVFEQTLKYADELYLTRINKDFNCTKFFPKFEDKFKLKSSSQSQTENGLEFKYEVWHKK